MMNIGILIVSILNAFADWQADSRNGIKQKNRENPIEVESKVYFKKNKMRVDTKIPTDSSVFIDISKNQAVTAIHAAKIRFQSSFSDIKNQVPHCANLIEKQNIDDCLKKSNFKFIKNETLNGLNCAVYFSKTADSEITLWRPLDFKTVPSIKTIYQSKKGDFVETYFKNIKETTLSEELFNTPVQYKDAKGLEGFLKCFK